MRLSQRPSPGPANTVPPDPEPTPNPGPGPVPTPPTPPDPVPTPPPTPDPPPPPQLQTVLGHEGVGVVEAVPFAAANLIPLPDAVTDEQAIVLSVHLPHGMVRRTDAEPVDFGTADPVAVIVELTGGIGADRVIDAVGVDAYSATGEQRESEISEVTGGGATAWEHAHCPVAGGAVDR